MKSAILTVVIAAGVCGFVSSSDAQEIKKLRPHPEATADHSLQQGNAGLPSGTATHPGGASVDHPKPTTGEAVTSGREFHK